MRDNTLETLLELNGFIAEVENGYWVKMEAKRISSPNINKPYGIKYSLTLHAPSGERMLGYDNAHQVPKADRNAPHDHAHKGQRILQYNYKSATKLLEDFWKDVDRFLGSRRH